VFHADHRLEAYATKIDYMRKFWLIHQRILAP